MNRCLSDRVLWALSEGGAAVAEREHVIRCVSCARRLRQLADEVGAIAHVLSDPPPARVPAPGFDPVRLRLAAVCAVVGVAAGIAWLALPRSLPSPALATGDGVAALSTVSTRVFAEEEPLAATAPSDFDVMAAAFDAAELCEWQPGGCRDDFQPDSDGID